VWRGRLEVSCLSRWRAGEGCARNLTKIKASPRASSIMAPEAKEPPMPTDTIVVLIMAAAFGIFAATLYWADLRTRGVSS
jgi:hypothetical protein